jgi:hypothetical protein
MRESFKLYRALYDGVINLLDKFFDMPRADALTALELYKASMRQVGGPSPQAEACV